MPGILFILFNKFYNFRLEFSFLVAFIPAAFIFPLVKPRIFSIFIFIFFAFMEIIQFSHLFYFHTPLNVFSLHLLFIEYKEVFDSATMAIPWGFYHLFVIIFVYGALIFAYLKIDTPKYYFALILSIILLLFLPYKAIFKTPNLANFMPRNDSVSLYNSLKVFVSYFFIYLRQKDKNISSYEPYKITYSEVNDANIVLIIGESVNANHVGLLGYERNTTPLLNKLAKDDKNFVAQRGISSSVLTRVSLPMFMNIAYNHNNIKHLLEEKTHLFRLAKEAGFKTFYFSNQTQSELSAFAPNYIDILYTKESYPLKSNKKGDLVLIDKLNEYEQNFKSGKNFIVFHQRSPHSPYENSYKEKFNQAEIFKTNSNDMQSYRIDSYDNALILNDFIISSIFNKFQHLYSNVSYIFFIPDHAEAMGELGENGQSEFGHAFLSHNVANIPIFASAYNTNKTEFLEQIKNTKYITHYEIALEIANLMGYKVQNPNYKDNVFYINGTDIAGNAGFIEVLRDKQDIKFIYNNTNN